MAGDNLFINLSGTLGGFVGSTTVNVSLLVGQSGATFIPIQVSAEGHILTSGVN